MRWALVGTGMWARNVHAPCLAAHGEVEFLGLWGRDAVQAGALADSFGVTAFASFDELLAGVDAVSFSVAPAAQGLLAARALAAGKHVLLEKPAATDPAILEDMARHRCPGQHATVFLTRLFNPTRAGWLRAAIGAGYDHAEVAWVSSALRPGSAYAHSEWRRGAGIVWDLMPHLLSQLVPVLGEVAGAKARPCAQGDAVMIHLDHAGGAKSEIRATLTADPAEKAEWIRFSGPRGETLSPPDPIDTPSAFAAALDTILAGADLAGDPVLRHATLAGALHPTRIMAALAADFTGAGAP